MIYAKYDHEIVSSDVRFSPVVSDVDKAKKNFDSIIRNHPKFICMNDNMNHDSENQPEIYKLYSEFHEKMFPNRSPFEYQNSQINEYLNIEHYNLRNQKIEPNNQSVGEMINIRNIDPNSEQAGSFIVTTLTIVTIFVILTLLLRSRAAKAIIRRICG